MKEQLLDNDDLDDQDGSGTSKKVELEGERYKESFEWGCEKTVFHCQSCHIDSVCDPSQALKVCPFCNSKQIEEVIGERPPVADAVCPFVLSQEEAQKRFDSYAYGGTAPNDLRKTLKMNRITRVYVPFWVIQTHVYANYKAEYKIDRKANGGEKANKVEGNWYKCADTYDEFFEGLATEAVKFQEDDYAVQVLDPIDVSKSRPYEPECLDEAIVRQRDLGLKEAWEEARDLMDVALEEHIENRILKERKAEEVRELELDVGSCRDTSAKCVLLPVWLFDFSYKQKAYKLAVDGRTGEITGRTPIAMFKIYLILAIGLIFFVLLFFFF